MEHTTLFLNEADFPAHFQMQQTERPGYLAALVLLLAHGIEVSPAARARALAAAWARHDDELASFLLSHEHWTVTEVVRAVELLDTPRRMRVLQRRIARLEREGRARPQRLGAWGLRPSNIVMVGTGERVDSAGRLDELRRENPGAECLVEFLDEREPDDRALLHRALAFPDSIVASDAMPVQWPDGRRDTRDWPLPPGAATHPRTAGTFAKALRLMVRESGAWSWVEAFRRCSYLPAQVLADTAPDMRRKGHLAAGADADIVVLDPEAITDRASYVDPARPSAGVRHLLVAGTFVVRNDQLQVDAFPGRAVRGVPH